MTQYPFWRVQGIRNHEHLSCRRNKSFEQARDILFSLCKVQPEIIQYQADLADTLNYLGLVQNEMGHGEEALKSANQAIPLLVALRQREPLHPTYRLLLIHKPADAVPSPTLSCGGRHRLM